MERAINAFISRRQNAEVDAYQTLSLREREVMQLASQGCSNSEIAKRLFISRRTVEIHRANLHRKLGLKALRNQFSEYVLEWHSTGDQWCGAPEHRNGKPIRASRRLRVPAGSTLLLFSR